MYYNSFYKFQVHHKLVSTNTHEQASSPVPTGAAETSPQHLFVQSEIERSPVRWSAAPLLLPSHGLAQVWGAGAFDVGRYDARDRQRNECDDGVVSLDVFGLLPVLWSAPSYSWMRRNRFGWLRPPLPARQHQPRERGCRLQWERWCRPPDSNLRGAKGVLYSKRHHHVDFVGRSDVLSELAPPSRRTPSWRRLHEGNE